MKVLMRRGAIGLLYLARQIMPASRLDWVRDMKTELDYVESDAAALHWAFGCVLASANERMKAMFRLNGQISRPILVLEWLMCFAPLTLAWSYAVSYIVSYEHIPLDIIIVASATGLLGPVALIVSMVATMSGWSERVGRVACSLAGAFGVLSVLQLVNAGAVERLNLQWFQFDVSMFVLCSLLPLLGCLHLVQLARVEKTNTDAFGTGPPPRGS